MVDSTYKTKKGMKLKKRKEPLFPDCHFVHHSSLSQPFSRAFTVYFKAPKNSNSYIYYVYSSTSMSSLAQRLFGRFRLTFNISCLFHSNIHTQNIKYSFISLKRTSCLNLVFLTMKYLYLLVILELKILFKNKIKCLFVESQLLINSCSSQCIK